MVMFKWHTGGNKPCFACTRWNGRIFPNLDAVPELPVHPNCECFIEAMVDPKTEREMDKIGNELERIRDAATEALAAISAYNLSPWFGERILGAVRRLEDNVRQFIQTIEIFWRNYWDMRRVKLDGGDKYFHSKANAEAAQLGPTGEAVAKFIGEAREVVDFWKYLLRDKMAVEDIIIDMNKDLKANAYGRKVGRENPDEPASDLVDIYRPKGLNEKY